MAAVPVDEGQSEDDSGDVVAAIPARKRSQHKQGAGRPAEPPQGPAGPAGHQWQGQGQGPLLEASNVLRGRISLCRQEELHLVGKLGGREAVAAVSSGPKG